jgi:hypothetical protein
MSINDTLKSRATQHGPFMDNGRVIQGLKDIARSGIHWDDLDPDMKEAIDMILHKIGRIINGDPYHLDHWHDIQGYAKLVEQRLETTQRGPKKQGS